MLFGVACLYAGAEALIKGTIKISSRFHIKPALIALTIIAFGTSVPEFTVTIIAAMRGMPDMALGNIIGSNVANIGLVFGIVSMIRPINSTGSTALRDISMGIATVLLFFIFSLDGRIGRMDGIIFILFMLTFIVYSIKVSERSNKGTIKVSNKYGFMVSMSLLMFGIIGVVLGGHFFIKAAVSIAREFGISEFFIGLTMIAVGTSLPELATSAVAAIRKHDEICLSNVIGSNINNILLGIGVAAIIHPIPVSGVILSNEFVFLILFTVILLPIIKFRKRIGRIEGLAFLAAYAVFIYFAYIK